MGKTSIFAVTEVGHIPLTGPLCAPAALPIVLQFHVSDRSIPEVTVPSRRDGRNMSRRRGQRGSVNAVGKKYVGRYWADEPGSSTRIRRAVEIDFDTLIWPHSIL